MLFLQLKKGLFYLNKGYDIMFKVSQSYPPAPSTGHRKALIYFLGHTGNFYTKGCLFVFSVLSNLMAKITFEHLKDQYVYYSINFYNPWRISVET